MEQVKAGAEVKGDTSQVLQQVLHGVLAASESDLPPQKKAPRGKSAIGGQQILSFGPSEPTNTISAAASPKTLSSIDSSAAPAQQRQPHSRISATPDISAGGKNISPISSNAARFEQGYANLAHPPSQMSVQSQADPQLYHSTALVPNPYTATVQVTSVAAWSSIPSPQHRPFNFAQPQSGPMSLPQKRGDKAVPVRQLPVCLNTSQPRLSTSS